MSKQHNIRGAVCVLIMSMVSTPHHVEAKYQPEDRDWASWAEYLHHYPDYQEHQEPEDIAVNGCRWGTWVTFPNKIVAIATKVGPWERPEALFRSQDFIAMYKHPRYYQKHCLAYLADSRPSEQQKQIAIYALENLGEKRYVEFAKDCYILYKQQQLSAALFQLVLSFEFLRIHPLVAYYNRRSVQKFLRQVQAELGADTPIGWQIEKILSGELSKAWGHKEESPYFNYQYALPFIETMHRADKEFKEYLRVLREVKAKPYTPPYFLMILDHPDYYFWAGVAEWEKDDAEGALADPRLRDDEKNWVIIAMHRLGMYGLLLRRVCSHYRWGRLPLHLMEEMLRSRFPTPDILSTLYKYPLFILDYKEKLVQEALDELIALPTIPCGLKEMAKKIKKGKLATAQEMKYMEGYREFRKTHFTLYETIELRKR
ncbi:MAG: hypothetical protein MI674_03645 [Cytophagales bacterium]|nr:hypothetical protein [Cytophagales bacterium]